MKPSIGRIVHFHREIVDPSGKSELRTYPAIIITTIWATPYPDAGVEPDKVLSAKVDLEVFGCKKYGTRNDESPWWTAVPYSPDPKDGHWSWPLKGD